MNKVKFAPEVDLPHEATVRALANDEVGQFNFHPKEKHYALAGAGFVAPPLERRLTGMLGPSGAADLPPAQEQVNQPWGNESNENYLQIIVDDHG